MDKEKLRIYFNKLSEEEKFIAFKNMFYELEWAETLCVSDEDERIYWETTGTSLELESE